MRIFDFSSDLDYFSSFKTSSITNMNMKIFLLTWKTELADRNFRKLFIIAVFATIITIILFANYRIYNETRVGVEIPDPFLSLFSPIDLTWSTFAMIYLGLLTGIYFFVQRPRLFVQALLTYTILVLFRMLLMYSLPLESPHDIIALRDPLVEYFGSEKPLDKDYFFSGHTATMFMLFLLSYKSKIKWVFLVGSILIGLSVVIQHTHYAVDALVAPFVAYASYRIALSIVKYKLGNTD